MRVLSARSSPGCVAIKTGQSRIDSDFTQPRTGRVDTTGMSQTIFAQPHQMSWPDASRVSNSEQPAAAAGIHQSPAPTRLATGTRPMPRIGAATMHTSAIVACSYDAQLGALIDADLFPGEPAFVGFARKERELGETFAALPIMDQRALHTRLSHPKAGDTLAAKFGRMTSDRRARLIAFLGDARRRAAHCNAAKAR